MLDEPTIGLDMISKERLRHFLVAEQAEFGTTLLLTTHDMGDIERLCDRVLVIDRGRLVFDGTLANLAERVALQRVLVVDLPEPSPDLQVSAAAHIGSDLDGQRQRLAFSPKETTAARVLAEVSAVTEVVDLTWRNLPSRTSFAPCTGSAESSVEVGRRDARECHWRQLARQSPSVRATEGLSSMIRRGSWPRPA